MSFGAQAFFKPMEAFVVVAMQIQHQMKGNKKTLSPRSL